MELSRRIDAFVHLGEALNKFNEYDFEHFDRVCSAKNQWFTKREITNSIKGISHILTPDSLKLFVSKYDFSKSEGMQVGVVMAGNIPLVGFHDFLCVLLSGAHIHIKLSSNDDYLIKELVKILIQFDEDFKNRIFYSERFDLKKLDAVIATGSDNTSRYFEQYFSSVPNIIRKNRTSCAVLTGSETAEELSALGNDVFDYYGLGCRNVTKLYIPKGYDIPSLLDQWESFNYVMDLTKYANNYTYYKSILLVNVEKHLDTGYLLLKETTELHTPIAVLAYEYYENDAQLSLKLASLTDKLQCVVSKNTMYSPTIGFGEAQRPGIDDFADGVDTMEFLSGLRKK